MAIAAATTCDRECAGGRPLGTGTSGDASFSTTYGKGRVMERLPFFLRLLQRRARAAAPYEVRWERDLEVPAADGSTLLTDHYAPVTDEPRPVLLVRSAYGRGFPWNSLYGASFAAQGF